MLLPKRRNPQEGSKSGTHAPSLVTSPSSCCEMRNIQPVVTLLPLSWCCVQLCYLCLLFRSCVCMCVGQLQQSLLAFGRSTRKLIRDVMDEQQRALDVLSGQVQCPSFSLLCREDSKHLIGQLYALLCCVFRSWS